MRVGVGEARDEVEVEPLVDHAEEAEARPGDRALELVRALHRCGVGRRPARRVVLGIDGAGQAEDVRIGIALGFVEARPAGDDEIGALQQRGLALAHLARRALERGELVHAVVDDRARIQSLQERQRHRRVEPHAIPVEAFTAHRIAHELAHDRELIVVEAGGADGRVRPQHAHVRHG